jgi:hypothetical protein
MSFMLNKQITRTVVINFKIYSKERVVIIIIAIYSYRYTITALRLRPWLAVHYIDQTMQLEGCGLRDLSWKARLHQSRAWTTPVVGEFPLRQEPQLPLCSYATGHWSNKNAQQCHVSSL